MAFKSDLEIAQSAQLQPIQEIAVKLGIPHEELELYGKYKAKLPLKLIDDKKLKKSKLILVTAMTPTPAGEGKTTTSIGLCEGLNKIGKNTTVVLREPSLGPVFGMKGGAAGGGYSQVVPMEDINLHFTGDFAAVEKANNLLAALIDNDIQKPGGGLGIDPRTVEWKRVMDMNDRALRNMVSGLGGRNGGMIRETGFNITAASEIMAILCLAKDLDDLKKKIGNVYIGDTYDHKAVFARDLKAQGAVALLLKDAIKPNLVQTLEGNPAIIHGGPFGNIAQGANSIIATRMGMSLSDYVVTEAGFGSDLGAEKFIDIVCGYGDFSPHAIVLVATIRALKYHGGVTREELTKPNKTALEIGFHNLEKHIENTKIFGVPAVISLNKFITDSDEEINWVMKRCDDLGVPIALSEGWEKGGKGMLDLAEKISKVADNFTGKYWPVYDWKSSVQEKIETVAVKIYGAKGVEFLPKAKQNLNRIDRIGLNGVPVCIAKTQNSLSDDARKLGRPKDFVITVREIEVAAGAGFIIPITGDILRMPGLPNVPAAIGMDIDNDGKISGLYDDIGQANKNQKVSDSGVESKQDLVAIEEPLEIRIGFGAIGERQQKNLSVTMRTPGHDFELAFGFLFTEGIINHFNQIESIKYCEDVGKQEEKENVVRVELKPEVKIDFEKLQRHFYTSSSCGVCGKSSIDSVRVVCQKLEDQFSVSTSVIHRLPDALRKAQHVFEYTGGLHAVGLFDAKGELILVREDVGRHNALDKVIGAMLFKNEVPLSNSILLVSGRASFELVQKAAVAGIPILAAVGAPSSLAVQLAKDVGMTLLGFVRDKRFNIYCEEQRIIH